jgi:WD40 repeat protein
MRERAILHHPSQYVTAMAFGPDGSSLYTGDYAGDDEGVRRWDVKTGKESAKIFDANGRHGVRCLAFSPDGKTIASTDHGWGATVQLWDIATRKQSAILAGGEPDHRVPITHMSYCSGGKSIVTLGGEDRRPRLWDVSSGKLLRTFGELQDFYFTSSLAVSSDGKTIVTAGGVGGMRRDSGEVRLWDVDTGRSLGRYQGHAEDITCVAFSPDGKTLATGSMDKNELIILWNFENSRLTRKLQRQGSLH